MIGFVFGYGHNWEVGRAACIRGLKHLLSTRSALYDELIVHEFKTISCYEDRPNEPFTLEPLEFFQRKITDVLLVVTLGKPSHDSGTTGISNFGNQMPSASFLALI